MVYTNDAIIKAVMRLRNETPLVFHYDGVTCGREGYEKECDRLLNVNFEDGADHKWHNEVSKIIKQPSLDKFKAYFKK